MNHHNVLPSVANRWNMDDRPVEKYTIDQWEPAIVLQMVYSVLGTVGLTDQAIAMLLPTNWPALIGKPPAKDMRCCVCHKRPVTTLVHGGDWWYIVCDWCGERATRIGFKTYRPKFMLGMNNAKKE